MGKRGPQPVDQAQLEFWYGMWSRTFHGMRFGRFISREMRFEPEPELWQRLLDAKTPRQVRSVCDESPFWLNPKRGSIMLYRVLSENPKMFLAAKFDPRWPKSTRPTNEGRRIQFLARSMAGIAMGISIRTAQDLLGRADTETLKLEPVFRPMCICGHLARDHADRRNCKYCSCSEYKYSGGGRWEPKHQLGDANPSDGFSRHSASSDGK